MTVFKRTSRTKKTAPYVLYWWGTLTRPERIVAMSLAAGGIISIVNSTAWAIASSYMTRQKTRVALAKLQLDAAELAARQNTIPEIAAAHTPAHTW